MRGISGLAFPPALLAAVMASQGYPDKGCQTGLPIGGLDENAEDLKVFHAGARNVKGQMQTAGGRAPAVTAWGKSVAEARQRAYKRCGKINWPGAFYRPDIGLP